MALIERVSAASSSALPSGGSGRRVDRCPSAIWRAGGCRVDRSGEATAEQDGDRRADGQGDPAGDEEERQRLAGARRGLLRDDGDDRHERAHVRRGGEDERSVGAAHRPAGSEGGRVEVGGLDAVGEGADERAGGVQPHELDPVDAQRPAQLAEHLSRRGLLSRRQRWIDAADGDGERLGLLAQHGLGRLARLHAGDQHRRHAGDQQRPRHRQQDHDDEPAGHAPILAPSVSGNGAACGAGTGRPSAEAVPDPPDGGQRQRRAELAAQLTDVDVDRPLVAVPVESAPRAIQQLASRQRQRAVAGQERQQCELTGAASGTVAPSTRASRRAARRPRPARW